MSSKHIFSLVIVVAIIAILATLGNHSQQSIAADASSTKYVKAPESAEPAKASQNSHKSVVKMAALKEQLEEKLRGLEIKDIEESPVEGFYQVFYAGEVLYVKEDGQFLFTGDLLELAENAPINHSEMAVAALSAKQAPMRKEVLASMNENDMVVFKAEKEKHVITVFTDVDCTYCRKLHQQIGKFNDQGVTIRYLAYPRAGIGSSAYNKLVSIWCSEDRHSAMDDAKLRRKFGNKTCKNPIADQYQMTRSFNLSGTPALVLEDGELIVGLPPIENLVQHLNQKASIEAAQATPGS